MFLATCSFCFVFKHSLLHPCEFIWSHILHWIALVFFFHAAGFLHMSSNPFLPTVGSQPPRWSLTVSPSDILVLVLFPLPLYQDWSV